MKRSYILIAALLPILTLIISCDDSSNIGSSIVADQIYVTVDTNFTVTGHTVSIGQIQSRTTNQLIGRIDAKGFGRMSSDVVTQFMPALQLDTAHITVEGIDSLIMSMYVSAGEFIGDSVAPMGLDVYPLTKILPSPIYSDFNPTDYYSPDNKIASTIYNLSSNSAGYVNKEGYYDIKIKLPLSFARDLYAEYQKSPSTFSSPTAFAEFFPGFYIKNSFGSGRVARVTATRMAMYYHYDYHNETTGRDTTMLASGTYFAVTPEIITNNNIDLEVSPEITAEVDKGETIVLAPAGLEVEIRFPAPEIIAAYKANNDPVKVLNTLTFSVPGVSIANDNNIAPPTYLLLVLSKNKDQFFAKNTLPDNVTSFYATYDTATGMYNFGDMRSYIIDLMDKDTYTEEDYTFTITPVSAYFETNNNASSSSYYYYYYYGYGMSQSSQTLAMLTPYAASPVMGKLDLDRAKIKLTFSSQSISR